MCVAFAAEKLDCYDHLFYGAHLPVIEASVGEGFEAIRDGHPLMQRMHRPEDEKRMVVILDQKDYGPWLEASVGDAPRFFRQWQGPLLGEPDERQNARTPERQPRERPRRSTAAASEAGEARTTSKACAPRSGRPVLTR